MRYYPLFIDLHDKEVLLVGAGTVGRRKLQGLARTPVRRIHIVDPKGLDPAYGAALLAKKNAAEGPDPKGVSGAPTTPDNAATKAEQEDFPPPELAVYKRAFAPEDLEGMTLVFAASESAFLNEKIAQLCSARGIWCNCASSPHAGNFFVPASCAVDELTIAIGTEGKSPGVARKLRQDLEAWLGNRYTPLLRLMSRIRPVLLSQGLCPEENRRILRALADSDLPVHLENKDREKAAKALTAHLPHELHALIDGFLYEL